MNCLNCHIDCEEDFCSVECREEFENLNSYVNGEE